MKKLLVSASALGFLTALQAEPLSQPVLDRYEQMLLKAPEAGTAFDKIYQHYQETEGLDALAKRWQERSAADGAAKGDYLLILGILDERRGKTEEALKELREAAALSSNWRSWLALAEVEGRSGNLEAAISSYKKAIGLNPPKDAMARLYRGLALSQQRQMDFAAAVETWEAYAKASPEDPFVLEEAGDALLEAGRYDDAGKMFGRLRAMKDIDPARALNASLRQAEIHRLQGNKDEALKIYDAALAEAGEASWLQREVRSRIERLFLSDDDLPGLAGYYRKQLAAKPGDLDAALRLSDILGELNRGDESLKVLQDAADKAPDRKDVQIKLAASLLRAERPADALVVLEAAAKKFPADPQVTLQLGEAQWQSFKLGKGDKALAIATWRRLAPENADAIAVLQLAEIFRSHQLSEEALAEYRRSLALDPSANDRRERLAEYLMELDRKTEAMQELVGMVEGGRASGESYLRLAKNQQRFGDDAAARKSLDAAASFPDRAFDRQYMLWQMVSEEGNWEEAEKIAISMRGAAGTEPEIERADECLLDCLREQKKIGAEIVRFLERQKSTPEKFTESDWRTLYKLAVAGDDNGTAEFALSEGLKQYVNSASLAKLENAHARRSNDNARRLAALERLEKLEPQRAGDWMTERVRALKDEGRSDEAIALAKGIIARSPARAEGHLLLADILLAAQKREEAVKALKEAVRLSENPNQVRFRLVDLYLAGGEFASARNLMDEAFEAEESPAGKLQLTNRLANVYLQDGQIDELIGKLRGRQKAEDGGWRYAMYLAEVYLVMQDTVRAMEELDKALAGKPDDPVLLKRLYGLAEDNGDTQAALRYARKIAEVEPSKQNRAQLGSALANEGKLDEALALIQENSSEFLEEPSAWQNVLRVLQAEEKTADLASMLESKLRADPNDWRSLMALGEILMGSGQTEKAAECFWKVVAMREDPSAAAQPSPTPKPASTPAISTMGNAFYPAPSYSSTQSRQMRFSETYQRAMQILANNGSSNPYMQRRMRYRYGAMAGMQTPAQATFSTTQDDAFVYLACIAARDAQEAEFLKKLTATLGERPAEERLEIYSMLQAPEAVLGEIEKLTGSGPLDPKVASTAYNTLQMIQGNRRNNASFQSSSISEERLKALSEKLGSQVAQTIQPQNAFQKYQWLLSLGKKEEAEKVVDQVLKESDLTDPTQAATAMQFAIMRQDFEKALAIRAELNAARQKSGYPRLPGQSFGLAMAMLGQEKYREKAFDLLADEFLSSGPNSRMMYGGFSRQQFQWPQLRNGSVSQFMPMPTTDLDAGRLNMLRSIALNNPTIRKSLPELSKRFAALAAEHNSASLRQAGIWMRWFGDDKAGAEKEYKALMAAQPADDLTLNYALMLLELKKTDEARKALDQIQARSGSVFEFASRLRLALAIEAKDQAGAKALMAQIQSMRFDDYEQRELVQSLTRLGLTEEAAKWEKKTAVNRVPGQRTRQMTEIMREQMENGDRGEATAIAYSLLSRDPFSKSVRNERYQQDQAARTLKKFGELDGYIDKLKAQLSAAPDSPRLNAQLAIATQARDPKSAEPYYRKLVELKPKDPEWLQQFGNILLQSENFKEAMDMYDRILAENPTLLFAQGTNFVEPYRRTKSWQRLADAIAKAPDSKPDPLTPYRQNYSQIFQQIGKELQRARPPVDPTNVWLRGLSWDEGNSAQLRPLLAQSLARAGRMDEARKVIEDAFFPPGQDDSSVKLFVFNRNIRPNTLWNQWTSYGSGRPESAAVRLMQLADRLGLLQDMLPRIDKIPATPDGTDPRILAHLVLRDPAILPEMRKFAEKNSGKPGNPNILRFYASELADWQDGHDVAYLCLDGAAKAAEANQDYNTTMMLQLDRADLAIADGKLEIAKSSLKSWRKAQADWQKQGAQADFNLSLGVAKRMAAAGMEAESREVLDSLKSDRNFSQSHYQKLFRQAQNEVAMSLGKSADLSAVLAWTPSGEGGKLVWDLRPDTGADEDERTIWMNDMPLRKASGKYTLEVYYGDNESRMKRVFSKPSVPARGAWTGKLPGSQGFVRAVLRQGEEVLIGPVVPVATGKTLIGPESLDALPEAKNGVAAGWATVPPVPITSEKGGPSGDGKYVRIDGDRQNEMEMVAERVKVDPKKNYLLGCWIRYPQNGGNSRLGWRVYDVNGKEINRYSANGNFQGDRWNFAVQRFGRGSRNSYSLGDNAAWIEPYVEFSGRCDLQGMFVTETDPLEED
jgi:tetratricopeptide (TPR) repeat protein